MYILFRFPGFVSDRSKERGVAVSIKKTKSTTPLASSFTEVA